MSIRPLSPVFCFKKLFALSIQSQFNQRPDCTPSRFCGSNVKTNPYGHIFEDNIFFIVFEVNLNYDLDLKGHGPDFYVGVKYQYQHPTTSRPTLSLCLGFHMAFYVSARISARNPVISV